MIKNKVVGIIGGMGPHATNRFLEIFYEIQKFKNDDQYPRLIVDYNTSIPSRNRAFLFNEISPLNGMKKSADNLINIGVNAIAIPCNSAHLWIEQLQKIIKVPIFNLLELIVPEIQNKYENHKIIFLGSDIVLDGNLFDKKLSDKTKKNTIKPNKIIKKRIKKLIYSIKENGFNKTYNKSLLGIVNETMPKKHKGLVVLACTELSYFKKILENKYDVIDSSEILAKSIFEYSKNKFDFYENDKIKKFWESRSLELKKSKTGTFQSTMLTDNENIAKIKDKKEKEFVLNKINKLIGNKKILELGSGTGRWTYELASKCKTIDSYEQDKGFVDFARGILKSYKNVNIYNKSVTEIKTEKIYDIVISIALLHYLNDNELNKMVKKILQVTKKNSYLIFRETFSTKDDFELHNYFSDNLKTVYNAHYRSINQIKALFAKNFKLLDEEIIFASTEKKPETFQHLLILKRIS